jgi:hypothetical protein
MIITNLGVTSLAAIDTGTTLSELLPPLVSHLANARMQSVGHRNLLRTSTRRFLVLSGALAIWNDTGYIVSYVACSTMYAVTEHN